jgi:hypothetical protein
MLAIIINFDSDSDFNLNFILIEKYRLSFIPRRNLNN